MEILNYKLQNRIYQNGYYDLWQAENNLGQQAIAKVAKESFSSHPGVNSAFQEEARCLSKLQHPYIIKVIGYDDKNGTPAVITALHQSESIKSYVQRKGPLKEEQALSFTMKLLDATQSLLHAGIQNFSPFFENIYITNDLKPMITGLGFNPERVLGFGGRYAEDQDERIVFQAPEVISGNSTNSLSANIYSCGVILYYLLKGKIPVDIRNQTIQEIYANILNYNWIPLFNISEKTDQWLQKLTNTDPEIRFNKISDAINGFSQSPSAVDKLQVTCKNSACRNPLKPGVKFCGKCGTKQ